MLAVFLPSLGLTFDLVFDSLTAGVFLSESLCLAQNFLSEKIRKVVGISKKEQAPAVP